jgi:hypothetical protein
MSLTELALLDSRRPLPLGDVIGLIYYYCDGWRVITAEETGTKPQERDFVSTALEKNGEIMLGCSGRNSLKEGAV